MRNAIPSRKGLRPFYITEAAQSCLITSEYQDSAIEPFRFSHESPDMGEASQTSTALNEVTVREEEEKKKKKKVSLVSIASVKKRKAGLSELKRLEKQKTNEKNAEIFAFQIPHSI